MTTHPVYAEIGKKSTFIVSLSWPGWCRRARDLNSALETFTDYRDRYSLVVGDQLPDEKLEVVESLLGDSTTDFGAPSAFGPWDSVPLSRQEISRQCNVLQKCWNYFDSVIATSPEELLKGPRGGGRDRDAIASHVREAERAYGSKLGQRIPPRTPWDEQRNQIVQKLLEQPSQSQWSSRYALRRIAWHVTDHVWEIQDRSRANLD